MDVAVIGGGVIGLAVAWRAAQRGMSVLVADPAPGGGAVFSFSLPRQHKAPVPILFGRG